MTTAVGAYATTAGLQALIGGNQTFDGDDTALMGDICDRVNQLVESITRQAVAPIASTTYVYDSDGLRRIFTPMPVAVTDEEPPAGSTLLGIGGLREVSEVQVAPSTGGEFTTLDAADYFIRGRASVNGPSRWLMLSDRPVGTYSRFPKGIGTVKVTATAGWEAIPDDLTETALAVAHRAWNARQIGQQDVSGTDEQGRPIVARFLAGRDKDTLRRYSLRPPV